MQHEQVEELIGQLLIYLACFNLEYQKYAAKALFQMSRHKNSRKERERKGWRSDEALKKKMPSYVEVILTLLDEENPEFQATICKSLNMLSANDFKLLRPKMAKIVAIMTENGKADKPRELREASIGFFGHFVKAEEANFELLVPHLDQIVSNLCDFMKLSEEVVAKADAFEEAVASCDKNTPALPGDSKLKSMLQERMKAVTVFGAIAGKLPGKVLEVATPRLEKMLDSEDILDKEAALIASGMLDKRASKDAKPFMDKHTPSFLTYLDHEHYRVRATALITLSNFSRLMKDGNFEVYMGKAVELLGDKSFVVQQCTLSMFKRLFELEKEEVKAFVAPAVKKFTECVAVYNNVFFEQLMDCFESLFKNYEPTLREMEKATTSLLDVVLFRLSQTPPNAKVAKQTICVAQFLSLVFKQEPWPVQQLEPFYKFMNERIRYFLGHNMIQLKHVRRMMSHFIEICARVIPRLTEMYVHTQAMPDYLESLSFLIGRNVKSETMQTRIIASATHFFSCNKLEHVESVLPLLVPYCCKILAKNRSAKIPTEMAANFLAESVDKMSECLTDDLVGQILMALFTKLKMQGPEKLGVSQSCVALCRVGDRFTAVLAPRLGEVMIPWMMELGQIDEEHKTRAFAALLKVVTANMDPLRESLDPVLLLFQSMCGAAWINEEASGEMRDGYKNLFQQLKEPVSDEDWEVLMARFDHEGKEAFRAMFEV